MSQDMRPIDPVPHPDEPSGSPGRQEMPDSATTSHDVEHLDQEHEEMNNRQYTSEEVGMMFDDGFFDNPVEADNNGQVENNAMNEGAKNPHGDAAVKPKPEAEGENRCQGPSFDYPMGESGHGGELHSSTPQRTNEILQDVPQDTIMKEESEYQGLDLGEREDGTAVQTSQGQSGVTAPTNEGSIWSEGPAVTQTDFAKDNQYAAPQGDHADVQSEQQYGEHMSPGTAHPLLVPRGREINQPSTFTPSVDFWKHRNSMQSGYEGNTMSMTGKQAVGQYTQPSNNPMSGLWPTSGMKDIQHQAFGRPIGFTSTPASFHPSVQNTTPLAATNTFPSFQPPAQHCPQQQPLNPYTQSPIDTLFARQQQLQAQVEEKRRQLENARRLHEQTQRQTQQMNNFAQNQARVPASFLMGPLSYQRAPQGGYRQVPLGNNNASHRPEMQMGPLQSQMVLRELLASCPTQDQEAVGKSMGVNRPTPGPSIAPDGSNPQQQGPNEESNDDEPLMTRTKRHASMASQTSNPNQPSASEPSAPPTGPIDWKLPQYDIHLDPTPADPTQPVAKVSLPGLVREELVLSPDHADQEIHLLLSVFLPGQRALSTPDPQPAVAVLNFHTIALMVIEAYVQFEIGDELGRRNPCYAPWGEKTGAGGAEAEYERIRDAQSADVDEIFFAVVDRWRAARESGRQSLGLIRGVQEFCDVALDVIYYVKENGLLGGEGQRQEQEEEEEQEEQEEERGGRAKGKGKGKEEGVAVLKAKPKGKRAGATEKTETGARKKAKGAVQKEEPKKRGRKPAGSVTVVKR